MHRTDMNGMPFSFPSIYLDSKEVCKIVSEIDNVYHVKYEGKRFAMHRSLDLQGKYCIYYIEIHGFSDYNIVGKIYD